MTSAEPDQPDVQELARHHVHIKKPKPPPTPPTPPKPAPSWTMPSPVILSDNAYGWQANQNLKKGTIGRIIDQIDACPLWECHPLLSTQRGLICQVENETQIQQSAALIGKHRMLGDSLAVVSTLSIPPAAAAMRAIGINLVLFEMNGQDPPVGGGMEPYGNYERMAYQAEVDGYDYWLPSYGCYDTRSLGDYRDYVPLVTDDGGKTWHRADGPQGLVEEFGCFSDDGMTDTNSWNYLP